MKSFILIVALLLTLQTIFSQQTKQDHLQKSKKQKTTAWIMLGGGTAVGLIGLSKINLAGSDREINNTPGTIMFFTGLASSIASIPVFIASKRNKRMAMKLSFMPGLTPVLQGNNYTQKSQPSVHIKISI